MEFFDVNTGGIKAGITTDGDIFGMGFDLRKSNEVMDTTEQTIIRYITRDRDWKGKLQGFLKTRQEVPPTWLPRYNQVTYNKGAIWRGWDGTVVPRPPDMPGGMPGGSAPDLTPYDWGNVECWKRSGRRFTSVSSNSRVELLDEYYDTKDELKKKLSNLYCKVRNSPTILMKQKGSSGSAKMEYTQDQTSGYDHWKLSVRDTEMIDVGIDEEGQGFPIIQLNAKQWRNAVW
jgi:hypothetical protein